jgi:ABC-type branched-subunit amino acid transport system permease subunit
MGATTVRAFGQRGALAVFAILAVVVIAPPLLLSGFALLDATAYAALALYALSLGLVWGYSGILCFGQSVFFGLGGYVYAVAVINLGDSTPAIALAVLCPALFAALLGYFLFYGRLSDVYLAVTTLTVTLIFYNLVNSTSGPEYRIGSALLGGFNGMAAIPRFNIPGAPLARLSTEATYMVSAGALCACYVGLRLLLASPFGRVMVSIRENPGRAELLGYDIRARRLVTLVISAAVAGLAGCLYANWGSYVSPTMFGLSTAAQPLIWILVGGLGTLLGPVVGAILVQYLVATLGTQQHLHPQVALGGLMLFFVLFVPKGVVPFMRDLLTALRLRAFGSRHPAAAVIDEMRS